MITADEVDGLAAVAAPAAARIAVQLFGLDDRFLATSRRWGTALMLSGPVSAAEQQAAFNAMVAYFSGVIAAHELALASAQGDTTIDALYTTTVDGQGFTADKILAFCLAHIVSGVDTLMYLLGNALAILAAQPEFFARLRKDASLVDAFRDEVLRFCGPAQRMYRIVTQDHHYAGQHFRRGDRVALFFGAATRDPAIFPAPDTIQLDRPNADAHLSYGAGIHCCPGRAAQANDHASAERLCVFAVTICALKICRSWHAAFARRMRQE